MVFNVQAAHGICYAFVMVGEQQMMVSVFRNPENCSRRKNWYYDEETLDSDP